MTVGPDSIGESISFTHKGRNVRCVVMELTDKGFKGLLQTDYRGKNEDWFAGETKHFYIKNCKTK